MRWSFKWREQLKSGLYYDLLRRGFLKPEDIEPCIDGFEFYLDAYRELSTSRPSGLDIQAIPFTAIVEYFTIYKLDDLDDFVYIIRLMDNTFLELNDTTKKTDKENNARINTDKNNKNRR